MATFRPKNFKELEKKISHIEVKDLPLHPENNPDNKIDEGSTGDIYKFTLRGKPAAVKAFRQQVPDIEILEIATNMLELRHANVVRLRGYSTRPSAVLLELCKVTVETSLGETTVHNLGSLVRLFNKERHFNLIERLGYIHQATCGLRYLHSKGIIHRDFKPTNLLVAGTVEETVVKVADFDAFVTVKETVRSTRTKTDSRLKGMTLAYTAPELVCGRVNKATEASDYYSWAITAFEVLCSEASAWTSVLPHLHDQILVEALKESKRPDFYDLNRLYDHDQLVNIQELLKRGWSQEPTERPNTEAVSNKIGLVEKQNFFRAAVSKGWDLGRQG